MAILPEQDGRAATGVTPPVVTGIARSSRRVRSVLSDVGIAGLVGLASLLQAGAGCLPCS